MLIKLISSHIGGHEVIEFQSEDATYRMGTFCLQIPPQIKSENFFEIPDDFMQIELGLIKKQNPLKWYVENREKNKDDASASNSIFEKFMDAVAKFCNYDRRGKMDQRQKWYENNFV